MTCHLFQPVEGHIPGPSQPARPSFRRPNSRRGEVLAIFMNRLVAGRQTRPLLEAEEGQPAAAFSANALASSFERHHEVLTYPNHLNAHFGHWLILRQRHVR